MQQPLKRWRPHPRWGGGGDPPPPAV